LHVLSQSWKLTSRERLAVEYIIPDGLYSYMPGVLNPNPFYSPLNV
jgi:hypothetical protein